MKTNTKYIRLSAERNQLLKALRDCVEWFNSHGNAGVEWPLNCVAKNARDVLAKVEGK